MYYDIKPKGGAISSAMLALINNGAEITTNPHPISIA
jgi:hypothetical protein